MSDKVLIDRELLGRALKADASIGANAIQLADGWKAMAELRALLSEQPQASSAQSEPAGEREAWTSSKPIEPGAYWVRGNGLEADALVQMKLDDGELWCNLHMRTTEPDFGYGYSVEQLSDDFEWLGPLHVGAAWQRTQSAGVPEGYALVPIDPTPKMLVAYMGTDGAVKRWKAMVAAAKAEGAHV